MINFQKKQVTAGERRTDAVNRSKSVCFVSSIVSVLHFATPNRFNPFHPSPPSPPPHLTWPRILPISSAGVSLFTIPVPYKRQYSIIRSRSISKDSTFLVDTLPHPIRLQCLPIPTPRRLPRRCHLDASRTETLIDIV